MHKRQVVEGLKNKLVGILTNRDVRFANDLNQTVSALMTKNVIPLERVLAKKRLENSYIIIVLKN